MLIATQVNNWNEARGVREKAQVYRQRLIADLRSNERDMRDKQDYYKLVLGHATAALDAFDRPAAQLGEPFLIDASQATQIYTARPKRFTYDAMVASGDLDLLGDLGDRVGTYYVLLDNVVYLTAPIPPYRERFRREIPYDVERPIRAKCSDVDIKLAHAAFKTILPAKCAVGLDQAAIELGVARLKAAPELDRDLSRYVFFLNQTLAFLRAAERRARDLRQAIEQAEK